jgi:hypothetical protein
MSRIAAYSRETGAVEAPGAILRRGGRYLGIPYIAPLHAPSHFTPSCREPGAVQSSELVRDRYDRNTSRHRIRDSNGGGLRADRSPDASVYAVLKRR